MNGIPRTSGLHVSKKKSDSDWGFTTPVKQQIIDQSGFLEGQLPFKYFGVPASSKSRVGVNVFFIGV